MAAGVIHDDDLLDRVRELRVAGRTPKQIARAMGVRPATVAPMVRALAQEAAAAESEPPVAGCWVNSGWSTDLTLDGHEDWPDIATPDTGVSGLVGVVVARRHRPHRVSVCGYLVDTYCLGVKDALGPRVMGEGDLPTFRNRFFSAFGDAQAPIEAPLDLARHLVWGAIDYACRLGFEPHSDFGPTADHLGPWHETSAITFGRHGVPLYIQGPHDSSARVFRTLNSSVGKDNYHFIAAVDATARW